ncbi:Cytoplasmic tRNA 2-thiolation protein 2 [Sporothrix epigloea]|uniref:Cytoplasmic tRNA 2-thiolation protein 2 n=1 Tax=Sporothrix epigloea TaxID=1892477 RepID=A0ABP0DPH0_9PEZI
MTKTVKRLEVLNRETRSSHTGRPSGDGSSSSFRRFYAGLSFGPSSAALVDVCEQIILDRLSRGRDAAFSLHAVHIDTDLEEPSSESLVDERLDRWRSRYPRFTFERIPLMDVLHLAAIDWEALLPPSTPSSTATMPPSPAQLRALLNSLPSATSRRDMLDLLVRRLLISRAASTTDTPAYDALLLGCSTTALAERTLTATAKGRGFSLPWQINDGVVDDGEGHPIPLYYPVRELFRNELVLYLNTVAQPPLTEGDLVLLPESTTFTPAVVSHKDLSIEEVMTRYFAEVELNYPSIMANVVRTTAKLERHGYGPDDGHGHEHADGGHKVIGCRVCGMPLDEAGNERWKGETGHLDGFGSSSSGRLGQLCYGCERSIHG